MSWSSIVSRGPRQISRRPLFRFCHRWLATCGTGGQLAGGSVGPEHVSACDVAGYGKDGRDRYVVDVGSAGSAVRVGRGVRYRYYDGKLFVSGRGANRVAEASRVECRGGWPFWSAADSCHGGRRGPHLGAEGAVVAGARTLPVDSRSGGQPRKDETGSAAST